MASDNATLFVSVEALAAIHREKGASARRAFWRNSV